MKKNILNTVYTLRTKKGLTQQQLAETIGVSRQTIIAIEKGNYTPSISLALDLADFFAVRVDSLLYYET